MSVTYLRRYL